MNCLGKKVQRNKAKLEEEIYAMKMRAMSPEEISEFRRKGQEAMHLFATAASVSQLAEASYTDMLDRSKNNICINE